jgi:predicted dehydrogenase
MPIPLRVALIGTGAIAHAHLQAYREFPDQVELVALCDINEDAARRFATQSGVQRIYTQFDEVLAERDIEAVDICTVHDQHSAQVIAAAGAGKHVLVEKPMGVGLDECVRMVEAAEAAGITFMVAQVFRYLPYSRRVRQLIEENELGRVWSVRCDDLHGSLPTASALADRPRGAATPHWIYDGARAGGGALITFSTHHIDLFRYYLGDIRRVTGWTWQGHPLFANGAEDRCVATLEFECGAIGEVHASFTTRAPWLHRYWIYGEEGTMCSAPDPATNAAIQHHAPVDISSPRFGRQGKGMDSAQFVRLDTTSVDLPTARGFVNEILHFADCCRTGRTPLSSGRDNLGTMRTIFGIYESARRGSPVDLADL